jgi:hypothetical protein
VTREAARRRGVTREAARRRGVTREAARRRGVIREAARRRGVIRERTITWSDPKLTADASRDMAGLDLMIGLRDGTIPAPPVVALVGLSLAEVEEGRVVMRLTPA